MENPAKRAFYLGRYNCIESLGTGPLGETFRGKIYGVAGFEKQFAVKRLHARLSGDEAFVMRFVEASSGYAKLEHDKIARAHEVNAQGSQYYIVLDLVPGVDLSKLLAQLRARSEKLPSEVALLVAADICEALAYTHERTDVAPAGFFHLGLNTGSVVATPEGEIKVLDFGLLGALLRPSWADDLSLTPYLPYVAPEQLRNEPLDGRADIFSLGAVLYELLVGVRAFDGANPAAVRSKVEAGLTTPVPTDPRVQALVECALQADRERRFPTVRAFGESLREALGARATRARGDLASLVRRLNGRTPSKTGTFAAVAVPSALAPPPTTNAPAPTARAWSPPTQRRATLSSIRAVSAQEVAAIMAAPDPGVAPVELVEIPGLPAGEHTLSLDVEEEQPTTPLLRVAEPIPEWPGPTASATDERTEETRLPPRLPTDDAVTARQVLPPPRPPATPPLPVDALGATAAPPPSVTDAAPPAMAVDVTDPNQPMITYEPASPANDSSLTTALRPRGTSRTMVVVFATCGAAALMVVPMWRASRATSGTAATTAADIATPVGAAGSPATGSAVVPGEATPVKAATNPLSAPATQDVKAAPAPAAATAPAGADTTKEPAKADKAKEPVAVKELPTATAAQETVAPKAAVAVTPPAGGPTHAAVIESTPPGAVYLDGTPQGTSPATVQVDGAPHTIVVVANGFAVETSKAAVGVKLALSLKPVELKVTGASGLKVRCKTNGELRIFVDGVDTGLSCPNEQRIAVAAGSHKIGLFSPRTGETYEVDGEVAEDADHSTRIRVKY